MAIARRLIEPTRRQVAIKHIDRVFQTRGDTMRILRELRLLRLLGQHQCIIGVRDVLLPRSPLTFDDIYIVFDLFDTDLNQMIRSKTVYDISHRRWIMYQILHGMQHVHAAGVFHRDLKPGNILVNANCDIKICDFGLARAEVTGGESAIFWTDYVASRWYRAPELMCTYVDAYTNAIDMWAVGCIFGELILRAPIFPGKTVRHMLELIVQLTGTPEMDSQAMAAIKSTKAKALLAELPKCEGVPLATFLTARRNRLPEVAAFGPPAASEEVELLSRLLHFDPAARSPASQLTESCAYFDPLRALRAAQIKQEAVPRITAADFSFEKQPSRRCDSKFAVRNFPGGARRR